MSPLSNASEQPSQHTQPVAIWPLMIQLLLHPEQVLQNILSGQFKGPDILQKSLLFLVMASILFALTTVLDYPKNWHISHWQLMLRFFFSAGLMMLIVFPAITLFWGALQKFSSWYWNVPIPFLTVLGIAGLAVFYYAFVFACSLPFFLLKNISVWSLELILLGLNTLAFGLSIRLFKQTYRTFPQVSPKKALFIAFFPIIILLVVAILLKVLTYFAVLHHVGGS